MKIQITGTTCVCPSPSHIVTDGQSVGLGVEPHLGLMTRCLLLLNVTALFFCGVLSLARGWVCLLYMLLVLASAVFLGSEYLETRDHILLSPVYVCMCLHIYPQLRTFTTSNLMEPEVFKTLVSNSTLTHLIAQEDFSGFICYESFNFIFIIPCAHRMEDGITKYLSPP
jgi:hypothetical protein